MAKGKGKKKNDEPAEPPHQQIWEQAVESKRWVLPPDSLPDSTQWPTWGALRERILTSCTDIVVNKFEVPDEVPRDQHDAWPGRMDTVTDGFLAELVKLSPPNLTRMAFVGCDMLRRVSLSPMGTCPALKELDLSQCSRLEYLLVQSESLETLKLSLCGKLTKVLLHCRNLAHLDLRECLDLESIVIWSDMLDSDSIKISECRKVKQLQLHHPTAATTSRPTAGRMILPPKAVALKHPPLALMHSKEHAERLEKEAAEQEEFKRNAKDNAAIPKTFRTM